MKHTKDRVVVKIDMDSKAFHVFANGQRIIMERNWDNFDARSKFPVQGEVISAEDIPTGSTILVHHNSTQDTFRIFDLSAISGVVTGSPIRYYSIPHEQCYIWKDESGKWQPLKNFAIGLRVFKPYIGILSGIQPTLIKNSLYITSGIHSGKVVKTLRASDYEIIFQGDAGREERIIRCRYFPDDPDNIRNEIIAVDEDLTEKCKKGSILVGLNPGDAKPII